jgi:hypothetical protein
VHEQELELRCFHAISKVCALVFFAQMRCMLAVIAARQCTYVRTCVCVFVCVYQAHAHIHSCKPMHVCLYVCCMNKAYAHGHWCKTMHACVRVCVWACTRRMVTVIASR